MRRCSDIVVKYDGIIDHFRRDAILGFFNVPIKHEDHVTRAVSVAQEIQQAYRISTLIKVKKTF